MGPLIFTVTEDEGNKIISALAVLPFQEVVGLISKLQAQYQAQAIKESSGLIEVPKSGD